MTPADARALRRRKAADLRAAEPGLSLRKMARRLGVSRDTVARDLEEHDRRAAESAPPAEDAAEVVEHAAPVVDALAADAEDDRGAAADSAPQASDVAAESAPPVEVAAAEAAEVAPPTEDSIPDETRAVAHPAPVARLPRRLADTELTIDLRQWPGLRRDLAVLAETGVSPEALINQAVVVLAHGYKQGLRSGVIRPDRPFVVRDLIVGPPRDPGPRRFAPAPTARGGPGTS
ncbi:hypothetical protein [Streptomyces sp. NPDC051665]|uniref:hypothetical protein n=1 Tax=Streptomyces sp. NPDC051665 TaxID=3154647 RepID=UPI00342138F6